MFTSRAEHRLLLREDNVLERLNEIGHNMGLVTDNNFETASKILEKRNHLEEQLEKFRFGPSAENLEKLKVIGTEPVNKQVSLNDLLKRVNVKIQDLKHFIGEVDLSDEDVTSPVEIRVKYRGYIDRQNQWIKQIEKLADKPIPDSIDYSSIQGLSNEEVEKLEMVRPANFAQAQRISGVNPSAIQLILFHTKKRKSYRNDQ